MSYRTRFYNSSLHKLLYLSFLFFFENEGLASGPLVFHRTDEKGLESSPSKVLEKGIKDWRVLFKGRLVEEKAGNDLLLGAFGMGDDLFDRLLARDLMDGVEDRMVPAPVFAPGRKEEMDIRQHPRQ